MNNYAEILVPETIYHVYNRANGSDRMFRSAENYRYFLKKYEAYISPVADTFCYCLMPNHFHFLIRIKAETELLQNLQGFKNLEGLREGLRETDLTRKILNQFSNFFNAYSKAFNKQHKRKGSLFMHPFKRKKVSDRAYLLKLVQYIHLNPVESGLCNAPEEWPFSSYREIVSDKATHLKSEELISWFEDTENFVHFHCQQPEDIEI